MWVRSTILLFVMNKDGQGPCTTHLVFFGAVKQVKPSDLLHAQRGDEHMGVSDDPNKCRSSTTAWKEHGRAQWWLHTLQRSEPDWQLRREEGIRCRFNESNSDPGIVSKMTTWSCDTLKIK